VDNVQFVTGKFVVKRAIIEVAYAFQASATSSTTDSLSLPVEPVPSAFVCLQTVRPQTQQTKTITLRNFKPDWLTTYPWMVYDAATERVYCKMCKEAKHRQLLDDAKFVKGAFINDGFSDWKHFGAFQGT